MKTKELHFVGLWIDNKKYLYCKGLKWKPFLECYKDWNLVWTFDNYTEVYSVYHALKEKSRTPNEFFVSSYRDRNIYLLITYTENDKDDYDYTVLRKVYTNYSIDKAKKYFGNLPPNTFVEHIYECVRYEIPYDDIEKVELEIAE